MSHLRSARLPSVLALAATALLLGPAAAAPGGTRVTVRAGDDLQAALDAAPDGATVVIRKGTYGPVTLTDRSDLDIRGQGKVILDGSTASNCILLTGCTRVSVRKLELRDSQASALLGVGCDVVTVTRCVVRNAGDEGIEFADSMRIAVDRNRIDGTADDGIAVSDSSGEPTNDSSITRNRIAHVPDGGIDVHGDDNVISRNLVVDSQENGILIASGARNRVERNRILRITGVGIDVRGDVGTLSRNTVKSVTGNGIDVAAGTHTITRNKVKSAGDVGLRVATDGNEVTYNRIAKSGGVDLQDVSGGSANDFGGNRARTREPADLD